MLLLGMRDLAACAVIVPTVVLFLNDGSGGFRERYRSMFRIRHLQSRQRLGQTSLAVLAAALFVVGGCDKGSSSSTLSGPRKIVVSILMSEDRQQTESLWDPLLVDMAKATGLKVRPLFASDSSAMTEAMHSNRAQVGWFSAMPAVEAVDQSKGEVIGRAVPDDKQGGYNSSLIVRKGSSITLADVMTCARQYSFRLGDPQSLSGTLAPLYYLFSQSGLEPEECFKSVGSADLHDNLESVAKGMVDVATYAPEEPGGRRTSTAAQTEADRLVDQVEVIWTSPALPESAIVVRRDLDPELKEKIRSFLLTYGTAPGAEGDRQRRVMSGLSLRGFAAADDTYLDPIRAMAAANVLRSAEKGTDAAKIRAAEANLAKIQGRLAAQPALTPQASSVH
jgi:phosphonate transport system substrate-binding protein